MDEKVLALKRKTLFGENDENSFSGFKSAKEFTLTKEIMGKVEFLLRKTTNELQKVPAEEDTNYKQIIPYAIITHKNKIYCYQRTTKGTENRLHNKYSIGIGGHINEIDEKEKAKLIEEGMKRELNEEIEIKIQTQPEVIGYINNDEGMVEKVHFGIVYKIEVENEEIKAREEKLANGKMLTIEEIEEKKEMLENWSEIILPKLKQIMK